MKCQLSLLVVAFCFLSDLFGNQIIVKNDSIERLIVFENDRLITKYVTMNGDKNIYIGESNDFSFEIDDHLYNGAYGWKLLNVKNNNNNHGENITEIVLEEKSNNPKIRLTLNYAVYKGLPLIRKWMTFKNISGNDIKLESLNIEDLESNIAAVDSVVLTNYARNKHLMKYEGNWDDPVIVVHHITKKRGVAIGNETIGVLKRSAYHTKNNNIEAGLTHKNSIYPFRKWIKPDSEWTSPKVFICLYKNESDGFQVVNNDVNKFVTNFMGNCVLTRKNKPHFVYNTWYPFESFIDEKLVLDTAKAAAECGISEYVIDDGWQYNADKKSAEIGCGQNYGDWIVDKNKFPNGLKPVFDYIKSLGMKPGLWISIASANANSKVFKEHPEWFIKDENGETSNLHLKMNKSMYTADFGTDWVQYIKKVILKLVKEHGLEYAKLDLAVVTSPYYNDTKHSGSYASDRSSYRDHAESFIVFYENLLNLFDELHKEAPDLFIDCTYETAGKMHLMDYAISQHADGNWLSNFIEKSPDGSLRVRQMAWWRSPAVVASSLVIGNMSMDDTNFELVLKSLIGTLPIFLGDPRKLSAEERAKVRQWSDWTKLMESKYDYMSFRKDLSGFGEPREGFWDGWQRINFNNNKGGIFGVFRQGGIEDTRRVKLDDLIPDKKYVIKKAPTSEVILTASGKEFMELGFEVKLPKKYDGDLFEVSQME